METKNKGPGLKERKKIKKRERKKMKLDRFKCYFSKL
jgi:uncharacterized protein YggL (DUF469 family)